MDNSIFKNKILNMELLPKMSVVPIDDIISEYECYFGRFSENYSKEHIISLLKYDRFNLGAARIYHGNVHTRTFLLESVDNWLAITRMISYCLPMVPVLTVCADLEEYAIKNNFNGIFASVNTKNSVYLNCFNHDSKSNKRLNKYPIYETHKKTVDKISLIKNILYNNVYQDMMFYPLKNEKYPTI